MHEKGEFSEIKGTICDVPIVSAEVCYLLLRPADSNRLIKLKQDFSYRGYVYFEPVRPCAVYQALDYSESHNKCYEDITISKRLSSGEILTFSERKSRNRA